MEVYQYQLVDIVKDGRRNGYVLKRWFDNVRITVDLNNLKQLVQVGSVGNVKISDSGQVKVLRQKVRENAIELVEMIKASGASEIQGVVTKVLDNGMRRYVKFYTMTGRDITDLVAYLTDNSMTKNYEISISGAGTDVISYLGQHTMVELERWGLQNAITYVNHVYDNKGFLKAVGFSRR